MVVMVWRTIAVRVRPDDLLVFRPHGGEEGEEGDAASLWSPGDADDDQGLPQPHQAEDGGVPPTVDVLPGGETRPPSSQRGLWQKVCFFLNWPGEEVVLRC